MDTPLVSVILATYNGSRFLWEAIESVLAQEYPNLELIIIDDASTDREVWQIIESYQKTDSRISTYRNDRNGERSWSKNLWTSKAQWEYIAFIDDDDIWMPQKLSEQIDVLLHQKNIWIVGTYTRFVDESGNILWDTTHLQVDPRDIRNNLLFTNQFIHSSVFMRKSIFEEVWGFPIDMHLCEDYDLWLRVCSLTGEPISQSVSCTTAYAHRARPRKISIVWSGWLYRLSGNIVVHIQDACEPDSWK